MDLVDRELALGFWEGIRRTKEGREKNLRSKHALIPCEVWIIGAAHPT